jgi:hypothetical protein
MVKLLYMLVGNIRVYCRVRPLIGQNKCGIVCSVEEESISIITPSKNGKEVKKTFTFNKVFGPSATQGLFFCCPFSSKVTLCWQIFYISLCITTPIISAVFDSYIPCVCFMND